MTIGQRTRRTACNRLPRGVVDQKSMVLVVLNPHFGPPSTIARIADPFGIVLRPRKLHFQSPGPLSDDRLDDIHDPSQAAAVTIPPTNRALTPATITSPHFVSTNHPRHAGSMTPADYRATDGAGTIRDRPGGRVLPGAPEEGTGNSPPQRALRPLPIAQQARPIGVPDGCAGTRINLAVLKVREHCCSRANGNRLPRHRVAGESLGDRKHRRGRHDIRNAHADANARTALIHVPAWFASPTAPGRG